MPLKYFILLIIATCNIAWALFIWLRNPKDKINIFFSLTVFGLSIWSALVAMLGLFISSHDLSITIRKDSFIAPLFAVLNFLIFTYYYPYRKKVLSSITIALLLLSFTVTVILVSSDIFIKEAVNINGEWIHTYNPLIYGVFSLVLLFYLWCGFYNLFSSALTGDKGIPYRARVVIVASGAVAVFGLIFSLLMPYIDPVYTRFNWIGPASSLFMISYISYCIFLKRHWR
ncbi:MAG: hypothetical protein UW24_C0001G0005 [Parcubacteria group bacterium GW2011_GWA2_44_12]|nr:MAG: hypothetical protein UW24_C0001G0005 [Parcubacteria group bacterium GW2011_GWA2_44_12]